MDETEKKNQASKSAVAQREEGILERWTKEDTFKKTLSKDSPKGEFVFYDGPPFANGLPHYGHILASVIKDVIPRYKTMQGYHVPRRWGWDCHGLPVENLVEKELGLKAKKDIEGYGVEKFNEAARESVMRFADEWRRQIPRFGRWVDMENDYRTMDCPYTESIWWAFNELVDKGLVYEGFKSMHLCPRCETTLSNFEVTQGYKDIADLSVYVKFELVEDPKTFLVAWTTTPWTLPGNVALAVGSDIEYVKVRLVKEKNPTPGANPKRLDGYYIVAKTRLEHVLKDFECEIVSTVSGKDLVGKNYVPPFDYYFKSDTKDRENGWRVYAAPFVTTDDGTGIVHIAPAFGEDDLTLGNEKKLPFVQHVSIDGKFKPEVKDFPLRPVKPKDNHQEADIEIIKYLAGKGVLLAKEKINHAYPHCWRCDTPLLNYAASSWFVKVSHIKDQLIEANKKITWIPEDIRDGRFGRWLEGARDWAISRSRFWGAPLPVWKCNTCERREFIRSIEGLKKRTKSLNRFFLVRHGEAENNVRGIISADPNHPHHLTEKGKGQAIHAAEKLKKVGIDMIYSSPFVRTRETTEVIRTSLGLTPQYVHYDERIRELKAGEFDGKPVKAYQAFFAGPKERFTKTPSGGENYSDMRVRLMDFMFDIDRRFTGKNILIVTHDSPAWILTAGALGLSVDQSVALRGESDYFIENADVREVPFHDFPHNARFELDLHRPYIDHVAFACSCGGVMKRIGDVFDCWFESGSMPYGQWHYPFEHKDRFDPKRGMLKKTVGFPADFIAEGLDQTRGWFYSMLVLSVALFGESAYKRVVVNGIVLAEDGQKMSKKLKNYPDPMEVVDRYGVDALRYYLLSSPVVHGEDIRFCEKDVQDVLSKVINRLDNVLSFYATYADPAMKSAEPKGKHVLDRWILARLERTAAAVTRGLEHYELDRAIRPIGEFIEDLSTWYLRRSRDRFKDLGVDGIEVRNTMRKVLVEISVLSAPFMPFFAEYLYSRVVGKKGQASVHLERWPCSEKPTTKKESEVEERMHEVRSVVSRTLEARSRANIKVRQPLQKITIKRIDLKGKDEYIELIKDETNVKDVGFDSSAASDVVLDTTITPALKLEGQVRELIRTVQELRKESKLTPGVHATLVVEADDAAREFIEKARAELSQAASLDGIVYQSLQDALPRSIDEYSFKLAIQR